MLNKLVQLRRVTDGGLVAPCRWAIFVILQQENSDFNGILIKFRTFWSHMITKLLIFKSYLKELNCLAPSIPPPPYFRSSLKYV